MRLIFAGTPEFAATALQALVQAGHEIALVLTQPDRPAGRGMRLKPSAVKMLALRHELPLAQPKTLNDVPTQMALTALGVDAMIVVAYGLILPQAVLDIPRFGCFNIHASLLPRWRGAAPIQRALLAGDAETGITIMQMDAGLDTGALLLRRGIPIAPQDTAQTLQDALAAVGATSILDTLRLLAQNQLIAQAQDESRATYAAKITKEEARLDWSQNAATVERAIRAYNPVPGAFTLRDGASLKLWAATTTARTGIPGTVLTVDTDGVVVACGQGALRITELQRAGGKRLGVAPFLAGVSIRPGECWA